jgi:hypothetical protein
MEQPDCCICGQPCEPWFASDPATGYGHNPDPYGEHDSDRCCNACNDTKVIPARLEWLFGGR